MVLSVDSQPVAQEVIVLRLASCVSMLLDQRRAKAGVKRWLSGLVWWMRSYHTTLQDSIGRRARVWSDGNDGICDWRGVEQVEGRKENNENNERLLTVEGE
ncbi:hypothetical protein VTL71DRAFT_5052 [Oculimacula yallundae]|uniref:Uncharacterized protein n=1 Tax=Oculimacula yallundae TaxID=86028 RepID=A0ABR4C045_9HELO